LKSLVEYFRNSKKAKIILVLLIVIILILLILLIIGARDLDKESKKIPGTGRTTPEIRQENITRRIVKSIERGAKKVIIGQPTEIPKRVIPTSTPTPTPDKKIQIAKNVFSCLNGMRDEEGVYALGKKCTGADKCQITAKDHRIGLNVLWAETKYVEKSNDLSILDRLRKDIDLYLDEDKVPIISVELWDKIIFYDMLQSPIFSPADKTKIENLAKKSGRQDNRAALKVQEEVRAPDYQEPDFDLLLASSGKNADSKISEEDLRLTAIDAHEALYSYVWKNNPEDLKVAKQLLYDTLQGYLSAKNISQENRCFLGLTTARFYNHLKTAPVLQTAVKIFQDSRIEQSCWFNKTCPVNTNPALFCQMFTSELYKATQDQKYSDLKEGILDLLVNNNYDYLSYPGLFAGDGCFSDRGSVEEKLRLTYDNSLIALALLSK